MNNLKDKKGFTLVELLAVIVVLAVVMALAVGQILPAMSTSELKAFDSESKIVLDAASNAVSLIMLGDVEDTNYKSIPAIDVGSNEDKQYCFTMQDLVSIGVLKKELDDSVYAGRVVVTKVKNNTGSTTGQYKYYIDMHNAKYATNRTNGSTKTTSGEYKADDGTTYTCTNAAANNNTNNEG